MEILDKLKLKLNMGKLTLEFFKSGVKIVKNIKTLDLSGDKDIKLKDSFVELYEKTEAILASNNISSEDIISTGYSESVEKVESEDLVYYPKLDKDLLPTFQGVMKNLSEVKPLPSILDKSIVELEEMNLVILQELLYDELYDLKDEDEDVREVQLKKIFNCLFEMQPNVKLFLYDPRFDKYESRLYIDLISTPGIHKLDYVREFLEKGYEFCDLDVEVKRNMLLAIYKYYDTHTEEQIEKFNYILRSSSEVGQRFLTSSSYDFDMIFPNDFIDSFSKEDLSQLYRFYFCSKHNSAQLELKTLISSNHKKEMFVISEMVKKVNSVIGNSAVLLEPALTLLYEKRSFSSLLIDFYDTNIGSKDNEKEFSKLMKEQDLFVFKQLINYVIQYGSDKSLLRYMDNVKTINEFQTNILKIRNYSHSDILGKVNLEKVRNNDFDIEFKDVFSENDLMCFKSSLLYNLYGISLNEAQSVKKYYGEYIDEFMKGIPPRGENNIEEFLNSLDESKMVIKKEDYCTLEVFKAILNIVDLDINDRNYEDKIRVLQMAYLKQIKEKGFDHQDFMAASSIVEGLLNKMIMNTYNKRLFDIDGQKVIKVDDGVAVFDAGVNFDMIISSLAGVGNLYDDFVNMASKWNTASMSTGQGLCASHISAENIGVIDLRDPILGFSDIPSGSLYSMGPNDIFSKTSLYNLKKNEFGSSNRKFIPATKMSDETRYGYNEIILDRFMQNDEDKTIKMQPNYVVYYKFDNKFNSKNDDVYRRSLKVAKDFGIPIVVVDVPKIKNHEKTTINSMEEKLFSSSDVDKDLFKEIVTRYMNNYSGSLSISYFRSNQISEDFSIKGMESFFSKVIEKIKQEDSSRGVEWLKVLDESYLEERKKYEVLMKEVDPYKASVQSFILSTNYKLRTKISDMKEDFCDLGYTFEETKDEYINPNSMPMVDLGSEKEGVFVSEKSYLPIYKTLVGLANTVEIGTIFDVIEDFELTGNVGTVISVNDAEEEEIFIVENLVASYFLEDCDGLVLYNSFTDDFDSTFNVCSDKEFDFCDEVIKSPVYSAAFDPSSNLFIKLNSDVVEKFVSKIEKIDDKEFLNIFKPVIDGKVKNGNDSFEDLASKMLEKKSGIREEFKKLQDTIKQKNNENIVDDCDNYYDDLLKTI